MSFFKKFVSSLKSVAEAAKSKTTKGSSNASHTYTSSNNNSFNYLETSQYSYTGAKNTPENRLFVDGYEKKQLNRIIVYGGQRNLILANIELLVQKEQKVSGSLTEKEKDTCEFVHYALNFHEPIDKDMVVIIANNISSLDKTIVNVYPIVDEAEYNRCKKLGINYLDIYKKPGHRDNEFVIHTDHFEEDHEKDGEDGDFGQAQEDHSEFNWKRDEDTINTQTDEQARAYSKKWAAGDQNKYQKGPKERVDPNEKKNYKAGHGTDSEPKNMEQKDYKYRSSINKDDEVFKIFKEENIHQENLRKEFKEDK